MADKIGGLDKRAVVFMQTLLVGVFCALFAVVIAGIVAGPFMGMTGDALAGVVGVSALVTLAVSMLVYAPACWLYYSRAAHSEHAPGSRVGREAGGVAARGGPDAPRSSGEEGVRPGLGVDPQPGSRVS